MKIFFCSSVIVLLSILSTTIIAQTDKDYLNDQIKLSCLSYDDLSFYDLRSMLNQTGDFQVTSSSD